MVRLGLASVLVAACSSAESADAPDAPDDRATTSTAAPVATTTEPTESTVPRPEGERPSAGCAAGGVRATAGEIQHRTLEREGVSRTYDIAYPAAPSAADEPAPLVLSFHGWSGDAAKHEANTGIAAQGTAAGNVVVIPEGQGAPRTWEFTGTGSDARFVEALIDEVASTVCVDLARVYTSGLSAGSAFAIAYTCAHPDQIAAVAAVTVEFVLGCTDATSILAVHGTDDRSVPYQDGAVGLSLPGVEVRGTELNMQDWADLADCGAPTKTSVSDTVTHWVFEGCREGVGVELLSIEGGPHLWPQPDTDSPAGDLDTTAEVLAFLARHHEPAP